MARRGHSTTIGKFAKLHHDRRVSQIRVFGERLRLEQQRAHPAEPGQPAQPAQPQTGRVH